MLSSNFLNLVLLPQHCSLSGQFLQTVAFVPGIFLVLMKSIESGSSFGTELIWMLVVLLIFLYTIFILLDYEKVTQGWYSIIPNKFRPLIVGIMEDIEDGMNRYFRVQALEHYL